ncbi:DNA mismatch repair endonuclease MutL [Ignavibacteria bacterium]|nr:DNA mismatch repair endonuclease MutL [Bacteroidota bacterium]MCZ2132974.1 DNA mismatch repair endonuclease MutL [Bacteroidota bacterium]
MTDSTDTASPDGDIIHLLPEFLANQIAAGEVVQRPESAVKELVENACDAGATSVTVVVRGAGKSLIHIIDNGRGMSRADVAMSVKRHATSKIRTPEDLERIATLGFRGEALASIAAVALLEIRSRRTDDDAGWKLLSEPLKPETIEPYSAETGTQVIVRNLFYNVPARKKFLKSDLTEFRYISETMLKLALSRPDIRFVFYDGDTLIFDAPPSDIRGRVESLFGEQTAAGIIPVDYSATNIGVSGYVGQPHLAKQSRAGQFLFLNNRPIVSRSLSHAVFLSFEHLIDKNNHPFYVLNLTLDPSKVDVNVHPQKHEVKFDDERGAYNAIHAAVSEALSRTNLIPELQFRNQTAEQPFEKVQIGAARNDYAVVNRITGEIIEPARNETHPPGKFQNHEKSGNLPESYHLPDFGRNVVGKQEQTAFDTLFGHDAPSNEQEQILSSELPPESMPMWQLHNKYIFVQSPKGVIIIDQHNAHERVLYERALRRMNKEFRASQELLFPAKASFSTGETALITEIDEDLRALGYDFDITPNGEAIIKGVPSDVRAGTEEKSLREVIEQYEEYSRIRHSDKRDNLAASFACKSAVKTGEYLERDEMRKLAADLFACDTPYVCPHGRPVILDFSLTEFDRRFGRTS